MKIYNLGSLNIDYVYSVEHIVNPKETLSSSSEDIEQITQNFILKYPDSNLILTLGEQGSVVINKDITVKQVSYKVEAVDTIAAGDILYL